MPPHSEKAPLLTLHAKVARRFFDERTLASLEENKTEEEFYRLFSVAESLSKLSGAGLANYRKGDIDAKTLSSRLRCDGGEYALALAFAK
jgi:phosphopantetheinyl transferase